MSPAALVHAYVQAYLAVRDAALAAPDEGTPERAAWEQTFTPLMRAEIAARDALVAWSREHEGKVAA